MRVLYPPLEPYATHFLEAAGHRVYFEECGRPTGVPVLFLHGGPGAGCRADHRRFFDPERWRIILVDQRGAGRSLPGGKLEANTTDALIEDLEKIRSMLKVTRWFLFGGSWGSTLALLYGAAYPQHVSGLVLRGSFLARERDLQWFLRDGAPRVFPEAWMRLLERLSARDGDDVLSCMEALLHGPDELAQRRAAREWDTWSSQVVLGDAYHPATQDEHVSALLLQRARIEVHYARHRYFIAEGAALAACSALAGHPVCLIHGRRDLVCPPESSLILKRLLPRAELVILPNAGHIAAGDDMVDALVGAAENMFQRFSA